MISGGSYESNVIFSPKSYLPRSAMFNLTVDLFGESVNVLEVSRYFYHCHIISSLFSVEDVLQELFIFVCACVHLLSCEYLIVRARARLCLV